MSPLFTLRSSRTLRFPDFLTRFPVPLQIVNIDPIFIFVYYICMKVFTLGEEVLREKALPVEQIDDNIRSLIERMFVTMKEHNGIGLAGPQVGEKLRLFVVEIDDGVQRAFINPQIIETSAQTSFYEEGCLSIPKVYENIERPEKIRMQALNEQGRPFTLDADGLLARVIQHEYDHLEGVLFIDRGDPEFKQKTVESFKKRAERRAKKEAEKKAREAKIAAKIAAKDGIKAGARC